MSVIYYGWPLNFYVSAMVAREFLHSQGLAIGDLVTQLHLPLPAVMDGNNPYVCGDEFVPGVPVHAFCTLPITSRRRPEIVACVVERDMSVEPTDDNPCPVRPQIYRGSIEIPVGRQAVLDCIDRCRSFARYPQIGERVRELGEVDSVRLQGDRWMIFFGRHMSIARRIATCGNYGCGFEVDDVTGNVLNYSVF